jgi:hypothetical protein
MFKEDIAQYIEQDIKMQRLEKLSRATTPKEYGESKKCKKNNKKRKTITRR